MTEHDLTICIPAHNEAAAIGETLTALRASFPDAEILMVDDGSTDRTADIARGVNGVIVLSHARNIGYGAAIKTAMRRATRSVVAWYDSDGQHHPEDLRHVVRPVLAGEQDAVIGVRGPGSDSRAQRRPGKWLLKKIAELVVRSDIPDLNSGLRCFRRDVIARYWHLLPGGFSASSTSTLLMMKRGYRLGYVPIVARKRVGTSRVRILRDGWRTILLIVRILILFEAFSFFTILSLLQLVPGLLYGIIVATTAGRGFPVMAAIAILSGVLTFFMGLLCDQIVAMRRERFEDDLLPQRRP